MKRVERSELLDFATFEDERAALLPRVLAEKAARRMHVDENLTFLFENAVTLRWQIQEMMRAERMVREKDIQHELDTYNELLGGPGELGCTLLVEIEDERERAEKLRRWVALPDHVYARLADGRRVPARVDDRLVAIADVEQIRVAAVVSALLDGRLAETSHGRQIRDYLHVDDVAAGLAALTMSDAKGAFNIAGGGTTTLRDIINEAASQIGRPDLVRLGARAAQAFEPPIIVGDPAKAKAALGFEAKIDLASGMAQTIAGMRAMRAL